MKVYASQKEIMLALENGGLAAMSAEGQNESGRIKNATRSCVHVSASDSGVSFESGVSRIEARYNFPSGVATVEEAGETCVPVTDLIRFLGAYEGDQKVSLAFAQNPGAEKLDHSKYVQSDGVVKVTVYTAKDPTKIQAEAELLGYPVSQSIVLNLPSKPVVVQGQAGILKRAYNRVVFAIDASDFADLYNKVGIFCSDGDGTLAFVATDTHRCAITRIDRKKFASVSGEIKMLVDAELMNPTLALFDDDKELVVVQGEDRTFISISDGTTTVKITMVADSSKEQFPDWKKVVAMPVDKTFSLDRKTLISALKSVSVANKERSDHIFTLGADHVVVAAKGAAATKGVQARVLCDPIPAELQKQRVCLSTRYFIDTASRLDGEKIWLAFTPNEMQCRVWADNDPEDFLYLMQRMTDSEA